MSAFIRFTATVNGAERSVDIPLDHPWLPATLDLTDGDVGAIEDIVMNDETTYREFYAGADDTDYDADLEDATAQVVRS